MKKSTKGTVAAAAAGIVLMGGLGTQAAWQADGTIDGTAIETGALRLINASCGDWKIGNGDLIGTVFDELTHLLTPGLQIVRECTFEVDLAGVGISAKLGVETASFEDPADPASPNPLTSELDVSATYTRGVTPLATGAVLSDGETITAAITVELPETTDNVSQGLATVLEDITVTVSQA